MNANKTGIVLVRMAIEAKKQAQHRKHDATVSSLLYALSFVLEQGATECASIAETELNERANSLP